MPHLYDSTKPISQIQAVSDTNSQSQPVIVELVRQETSHEQTPTQQLEDMEMELLIMEDGSTVVLKEFQVGYGTTNFKSLSVPQLCPPYIQYLFYSNLHSANRFERGKKIIKTSHIR
jgi:hypothetical protein